uniref:Uncharacterized protein n=1 Tax=Clostridium botulinum TaxID=1491 RepID=A0A126I602_CLOBO|nr:hypothetical protein [Clostridium botulinum]ALP69018.1 hypothetical protein [Clostridium botulinum]
MIGNKNYKEKIIDKIKNEKLEYKESFNKSLINQYTYSWKISYKNDNYDGGILIIAPKYTDDTILEQAYKLAHELGHHNINKKLSSIMMKLSQSNNILIKNIIERKAWKEAKNICIEESIPIQQEFYLIKDKCLNTYTNSIKNGVRCGFNYILHIFISYYVILMFFYLICKGVNDNINDLFGILNYFNDIDIKSVYMLSKTTWIMYIIWSVLRGIYMKQESTKR